MGPRAGPERRGGELIRAAHRVAVATERWLIRVSLALGGLGLCGLVLVILLGVAERWVPGLPYSIPHQELAAYFLVFIVFTGLAAGFEQGFPRVTVVYDRLGGGPRRVLDLVLVVAALVYVAVLAYYAWQLVLLSNRMDVRTTGVIRSPLAPLQAMMAGGLSVFTLYLGVVSFRRLLGPGAANERED